MPIPQPTEEEQKFSIHLHQALCRAGFTKKRIFLQARLVDYIEDLYRKLYDEDKYEWRIAGSYGDVWGNNLFTFDGRTDEHESDVDWTCLMRKSMFHFKDTCKCPDRDEDYVLSADDVREGHVPFKFQQLREPAEPHKGISLRPKVDECTAYPCCSAPKSLFCADVGLLFDPEQVKSPMQLIQASRPGHENSELRFGFAEFERRRIRSLSVIQGHFFLMIKYFITIKFNKDIYAFKSYHAKTLLFFILQSLQSDESVWKAENLVSLLLYSFDILIEEMREREATRKDESSYHAAMRSFILRDCYIYFHKKVYSDVPHVSLIEVVKKAKSKIIDYLKDYIDMLRPLAHEDEGLIFHPYVLFPTRLTLQFYKSVQSENLYLRLQNCLQELTVLKADKKVEFLRHIESLPPSAFTASLCLKTMTHLKFGDKQAAIELLRKHQFHCAQYRVPMREIAQEDLERGVASLRKDLESTDTAWCFAFTYDTMQLLDFNFLNSEVYKHCITRSNTYPVDLVVDFNCLSRLFYTLLGEDCSIRKTWEADLPIKKAPLSEVYLCHHFLLNGKAADWDSRAVNLPQILDALNKAIKNAVFDRNFLPRLVKTFDSESKSLFCKWLNDNIESVEFIALYCASILPNEIPQLLYNAVLRASEIAEKTLHYQDFVLLLKMKQRLSSVDSTYLDPWFNRLDQLKEDRLLNVQEIFAFLKAASRCRDYNYLCKAIELLKASEKALLFLKLNDFRKFVKARRICVELNSSYLDIWLEDISNRTVKICSEKVAFFIVELMSLSDCLKYSTLTIDNEKRLKNMCSNIISQIRSAGLSKADATKIDRVSYFLGI